MAIYFYAKHSTGESSQFEVSSITITLTEHSDGSGYRDTTEVKTSGSYNGNNAVWLLADNDFGRGLGTYNGLIVDNIVCKSQFQLGEGKIIIRNYNSNQQIGDPLIPPAVWPRGDTHWWEETGDIILDFNIQQYKHQYLRLGSPIGRRLTLGDPAYQHYLYVE